MAEALPIWTPSNLPNTCANCVAFNWEQPEIGDLQKCTRCKMLQYCSKECQKEHWMLVHKSQCKKLAEIKNFEGFVVDTFKITHDTKPVETLLMLLWKTLLRIKSTALFSNIEVRTQLMQLEQDIQESMKETKLITRTQHVDFELTLISSQPFQQPREVPLHGVDVESVDLWHTLLLLWRRLFHYNTFMKMKNLKDPRSAVPEELWSNMEEDVGPFPDRIAKLIGAFSGTQFPIFPDLLKIWCGGNLVQKCSFCNTIVTVAAVHEEGFGDYMGAPTISLLPHQSPVILCSDVRCLLELCANAFAWNKWSVAVRACFDKLEVNRCDYCFKIADEVHRCGKCLTKHWCSRDCQLKDWEEKHREFCNRAADERKVKGGSKVRAKSEMEKFKGTLKNVKIRGELRKEDLGQVKEAFKKKGVSGGKKGEKSKA